MLNSAGLGGIVAGKDADRLGDKILVDGNTFCIVDSGRALAEDRVVDGVMVKTGVLTEESVSVVEEARESIAKLGETVERYVVEVARDCNVEVVEGVIITEDEAMTVKSTVVAMVAVTEDDVATVLVETVAIEDCTIIVLAGRLSALMMSAAFAGVLDSWSTKSEQIPIPSPLLHIRRPANVQLELLGRSRHRLLSNSASLHKVRSQRVFLKSEPETVDGLKEIFEYVILQSLSSNQTR